MPQINLTINLLDPRRPTECFECEGTGTADVEVISGCPVTERVSCGACDGLGSIEEPECRECGEFARVEIRDDRQRFTCFACLHEYVPAGCAVPAEIAALTPEPTDDDLAEMARELR